MQAVLIKKVVDSMLWVGSNVFLIFTVLEQEYYEVIYL